MSPHDHCQDRDQRRSGDHLTSPAGLVLIGFLIVAGVFLFTEHRIHVLGALVYVPLLICPLMHFFMHGGHSGHAGHEQEGRERRMS
jgi:Protein of unknown function (DUF2933)